MSYSDLVIIIRQEYVIRLQYMYMLFCKFKYVT